MATPVITSLVIGNSGTSLIVSYNLASNAASGVASAFLLTVSGRGSIAVTALASTSQDNKSFTFTINPVYYNEAVTLAYDASIAITDIATSGAAASFSGVTVTNNSGLSEVDISPTTTNRLPGATQQFTSTVHGIYPAGVVWSVVEVGGGTVTSTGLYTAPSAAGVYTVKVMSIENPARYATASVTVFADSVAPLVSSIAIPASGTNALLTFSKTIAGLAGFAFVVNGTARATRTWSTGPNTIKAAFSTVVYSDDVVTYTYTVPGSGGVTDIATPPNALGAISQTTVTNNSTATPQDVDGSLRPVTIEYAILSVDSPTDSLVRVTYKLWNSYANISCRLVGNVTGSALNLGVTDAMSSQQRQAQIDTNFLTLTAAQFSAFAAKVRNAIAAYETSQSLTGTDTVIMSSVEDDSDIAGAYTVGSILMS